MASQYEPLIDAAKRGTIMDIQTHLNGVNIDAQYSQGRTLLHFATRLANHNNVQFLLMLGANKSITDDSEQTPLQMAMQLLLHNPGKTQQFQAIIDLLQ